MTQITPEMVEKGEVVACGNCKHYIPTQPMQGACRAHPPTAHVIATPQGIGNVTAYPEVKKLDVGCGEHPRRLNPMVTEAPVPSIPKFDFGKLKPVSTGGKM